MQTTDFLIIGAGIVGLSIARELKSRYPDQSITVIEKEAAVACHSSGRNSGVLHSGVYYSPETLKAKVCRQGAVELAAYCRQKKLPYNALGKVLVPVREEEAPQLQVLADRAKANGVAFELLDQKQLAELEPETKSASGQALLIPSTAVVDPKAVMAALTVDLLHAGVAVQYNSGLNTVDIQAQKAILNTGSIVYGHAINAAGLHADRIAHAFQVGTRYTLLPFKGLYWALDPHAGFRINHLIYPVPDLRVPFLGIHTTTAITGKTYLGPTAVPAFGRENYRGLQGVSPDELIRICGLLGSQYYQDKNGFRRLAWQEGRRYIKPWFVQAAQALLPRLQTSHLHKSDKVGIRAQMLDRQTGTLVMDFLVEQGQNSTHVLNAISPAFTSAFPFARFVLNHFVEKR
ncbi:MAG: hypothetical protein BWK76_18935 [Desulfobulbaceae bacterium A2]|nr:MAG: hypothetical protein BWK76_18935 [Desulfobulbaceae bacterium A2]